MLRSRKLAWALSAVAAVALVFAGCKTSPSDNEDGDVEYIECPGCQECGMCDGCDGGPDCVCGQDGKTCEDCPMCYVWLPEDWPFEDEDASAGKDTESVDTTKDPSDSENADAAESGSTGKDDASDDSASTGKDETSSDKTGKDDSSSDATGKDTSSSDTTGKDTAPNYASKNKKLMAELEESRKSAIDAGAEAVNNTAFMVAEAEYELTKTAAEQTDVDITDAATDLKARYLALELYAKAKAKKDLIDKNDWSSYDKTDYDVATDNLKEFTGLTAVITSTTSGKELLTKARDADSRYNLVLAKAYKSLALDAREEAKSAKALADSVKASVSRKAEYNAAVGEFQRGDNNYSSGNCELSIKNYNAAKEGFETLYNEVSAARAQALQAIEAAKASADASGTAAVVADKVAPLEEGTAGIEDENAKLLDDDDFSQVEEAAELDEHVNVTDTEVIGVITADEDATLDQKVEEFLESVEDKGVPEK